MEFSVFRKPTNKDDFVHYLSRHSERTKTGTVIGFFLRALRICSEEYIQHDFQYIFDTFKKLGYPYGLLQRLKKKANEIFMRSTRNNGKKKKEYISVPSTARGEIITKNLTSKIYILHSSREPKSVI